MKIKFLILAVLLFQLKINCFSQSALRVTDDGKGRIFGGIGALSAGASSKLLMDYPPEIRSGIFDLLFKPKFGAGLQIIKVEIGGDINSTDGTEPSHAHNRNEFLNPVNSYFNRGYEWTILKEAKKRNPQILTDCLEWGCPGWIGNGRFYSQDNIDYIISFLKGAIKYQDVRFDYTGVWNERMYDADWIKLLRKNLDNNGFSDVKIIAPDNFDWNIADQMKVDEALNHAIYAIGIHYNERWEKEPYSSTVAAQSLNKPLYNSEGGPWKGDWDGFEYLVRLYNRNYILGKSTRVITWSLISSYYDNLSLPKSGLMMANTPWSGHFEIQPAIWATAHTTQFAKPGWRYVDGGCGLFPGGSYVTLRSNENTDYSMIIETMDTDKPQTISISLDQSFTGKILHVWKSTKGKCEFERQKDISLKNNHFTFHPDGKSVYSISTTSGQKKGNYIAPNQNAFPFPYQTSFENDSTGQLAKYFIDQCGVFEVHSRNDGQGKCLKQVIDQQGTEWELGMHPFVSTIIGDTCWTNYEVHCDVNISENTGSAVIMGRIMENYRGKNYPEGYWFKVLSNGAWELFAGNQVIANGNTDFSPFNWHHLSLKLIDDQISVAINSKEIASVKNTKYTHGLAGVGCDFNLNEFDNFEIK